MKYSLFIYPKVKSIKINLNQKDFAYSAIENFASCFWLLTLVCHSQQLIPYVEEDGSKNDDRAGPPRFASEERREIAEVNKVSY